MAGNLDIFVTGTVTIKDNGDDFGAYVFNIVSDDISNVLRVVAAEAINEQIAIGNKPTNIIVDNSGIRDITKAKKRIQAFFTSSDEVGAALNAAFPLVKSFTRLLTGRARSSYQLWFNNTQIGNDASAADKYLAKMGPSDSFKIVGPLVPYGRKLYWNPESNGKKQKLKKTRVLRTGNTVFKVVRTKGIMTLAADQLKRQFPGVAFADSWVVTSALPGDGRTPALFIGFKKRGRV